MDKAENREEKMGAQGYEGKDFQNGSTISTEPFEATAYDLK